MSNISEMSFSFSLNVMLSTLKMSKIDQVHLRAVILCMSKISEIGKDYTHTFLLITFFENQISDFQSGKRFGKLRLQPYYQSLFYVEAFQRC